MEEQKMIRQDEKEAPIDEKKTKCTLCGLCRMQCPLFKAFMNETASPRGKAVMLKRSFPSRYFYLCTFCGACENVCIVKGIDIIDKIRKFRQELVDLRMTTEANERMIDNIRRYGNTIGPVEGKKKVELFCC